MKITEVKTVLLTGPCTNDPFLSKARQRRSAAFVEIHTDTKLTGLGETYAGYSFPEAVPTIVDFFSPILLGQTVDDICELWQRMYSCGNYWCRNGLGAAVLTALDAALWDLKGKAENVPVHQLLGGARYEALPCYASGGPSNYPKGELAKKIEFYLSLGFDGFKLGAGAHDADGWHISMEPKAAADFEAEKMQFVREQFGPDVRAMLDGHMGNSPGATWNLETAQAVMKAVEPFNPFFFEEPLPYRNPQDYGTLAKSTLINIAGGECLTVSDEWRPYIAANSFDIGQPDASWNGGLSEFCRIAKMLGESKRKIATHAWGSGGSLMQNIHCGFACENTAILEVPPAFGPLHSEVIGDSFMMQDGKVLLPTATGLGIVLSDETKNKFPFVPGSGEFVSVPGKVLWEELEQTEPRA